MFWATHEPVKGYVTNECHVIGYEWNQETGWYVWLKVAIQLDLLVQQYTTKISPDSPSKA